MSEIDRQRILALDVRPQSFGFVAFEGPGEILDWGARSFRRGVNKVRVPIGPKVVRLIDQYVPEVLVLEKPRTEKIERMVTEIRKEAKLRKVPVRLLSPKVVDLAFSGHNKNKHQIAAMISETFRELLSILPPPRRPWESEDYRMSIFDAGAAGIAYFARKKKENPLTPTS